MSNRLMAALAIAAIALVGCDDETMHEAFNLQHDLLTTDFAEGDESFVTSDEAHARVETDEGTYRMTAKQPLDMPISSFGWFSRTAYNVHSDVTVVRVSSDDAIVGVMCLDGDTSPENGYGFWIATRGDGYLLWKIIEGEYSEVIASVENGEPLHDGQRIGIRCTQGSIVGVLDGQSVVDSSDRSFDRFSAVNLVWGSDTAGDFVEYDDLAAIVPE